MGEAEAKKRRIFAALGIIWATVAAATSTGEKNFLTLMVKTRKSAQIFHL